MEIEYDDVLISDELHRISNSDSTDYSINFEMYSPKLLLTPKLNSSERKKYRTNTRYDYLTVDLAPKLPKKTESMKSVTNDPGFKPLVVRRNKQRDMKFENYDTKFVHRVSQMMENRQSVESLRIGITSNFLLKLSFSISK